MELGQGHIQTTPILPVETLSRSADLYRRIGFGVDSFDDGYALVTHAGHEVLHLRAVSDLDVASNRASAYFHVTDVDRWHDAWADAGVAVGEIEDTPWGMREFALWISTAICFELARTSKRQPRQGASYRAIWSAWSPSALAGLAARSGRTAGRRY